jgi:hypothetical protein
LCSDAASSLRNLETTKDITLCVGKRLSLLEDDGRGNVVHVYAEELLQVEHDLLAAEDRRLAPSAEEGGFGSIDGPGQFGLGGLGHLGEDALGGLQL